MTEVKNDSTPSTDGDLDLARMSFSIAACARASTKMLLLLVKVIFAPGRPASLLVGLVVSSVSGCRDCGGGPADSWLGDAGPLCDRCFDAHVSALTGMPRLPQVPGSVWMTGPDGRRHRMRYRISRAPTGIVVRLCEELASSDEGYEFGVLGDHDAAVELLVAAVRARAEEEIGRCYLEPSADGGGWQVVDDEVAGRLDWEPDSGPHRVVVDGRSLSWEEFGWVLSSFEGFEFRLVITDRLTDVRSDEAQGGFGPAAATD